MYKRSQPNCTSDGLKQAKLSGSWGCATSALSKGTDAGKRVQQSLLLVELTRKWKIPIGK